MSVDSVLLGYQPRLYGPATSNTSPAAKFAARPKTDDATQPPTSGTEDSTAAPDGVFQNEWEQTLRAGENAAENPTDTTSGSRSAGQASAALALYKRVSLIGTDETPSSELLRRWNNIVQGGQGADHDAAAAAQYRAARFESGILDLTA